jgi:hypothetical protein
VASEKAHKWDSFSERIGIEAENPISADTIHEKCERGAWEWMDNVPSLIRISLLDENRKHTEK